MYDVVIVGGGPAGLNAALVLGRCRRRVVLCDHGAPRNARARELHGFLTRDGTPPLELLRLGREELRPYGIVPRIIEVVAIDRTADGFEVGLADGDRLATRTVLLASGVIDHLPAIDGLEECYGISVHHCPYCDGWEERDKLIGVIGQGAGGSGLALALKTWTDRVMLYSNGRARLRPALKQKLADNNIDVHDGRIAALEHDSGHLHHVRMATGDRFSCNAVFFSTGQRPTCDLARRLGCALTRRGVVKTDHLGQTRVPGLYVAGDASRDVQFAIVAAAEGAKAAVAINKALQARAGLVVTEPAEHRWRIA
jgi:thioredoxin reductase